MTETGIISDAQATPSHVAPLLPPTAPVPEPARRINFFKALLLFWLLPRRYGPHLAARSFRRAFGAHLISVVIGLCVAVPLLLQAAELDPFSFSALRARAAEVVIAMAAGSAGGTIGWAVPLMVLGAVPLGELGLLAVATALMPWCAGGDSAWSVWKRSVKNVWWSTTLLIPVSVIVLLATTAPMSGWLRRNDTMTEDVIFMLIIPAFATPVILLLRMLLVGASRYVGEPAGPAFAPREPRCDQCGYLIIGLPLEANCPECGLPVRESLPGGRRRPTVWQENELRPRGLFDAIRMQGQFLRDPGLFQRIPVHEGLAAARHFWWLTFCLIVLAVLAGLRLLGAVATADNFALDLLPATMAFLLIPLAAQMTIMSLACLYAQWRYTIRDYRISAIVCYYAAPLMWPFVIVLLIAMFVMIEPVGSWLGKHRFVVLRLSTNGAEAATLILGLLLIGTLAYWWLRLCGAMRGVRYANV